MLCRCCIFSCGDTYWIRACDLDPVAPDGGRLHARPSADLGIGALSGALAQTDSYPFQAECKLVSRHSLPEPGRWLRWGETMDAISMSVTGMKRLLGL